MKVYVVIEFDKLEIGSKVPVRGFVSSERAMAHKRESDLRQIIEVSVDDTP